MSRLLLLPLSLMMLFLVGCGAIQLPSFAPVPELSVYKTHLETVTTLVDAGVITPEQGTTATNYYVQAASQEFLTSITVDQIRAAQPQELSPLQKLVGVFTFSNFIWLTGSILIVGATVTLASLLFRNLLELLKYIPVEVYEFLFFLLSVGLIVVGWQLQNQYYFAEYIGLLGCLLFAGALSLTSEIHKFERNVVLFTSFLSLVWAAVAIWYGSEMIAFISIAALFIALAFARVSKPISVALEYGEDSPSGRSTAAAIIIFAVYLLLKLLSNESPLIVFEGSLLILGAFMTYISLLTAARSDKNRSKAVYIKMQVIAIGAGLLAFGLGFGFQLPELLKIGGTFSVLYLLSKILEIPTRGTVSQALLALTAGSALFGFWWYVHLNLDVMRPFFYLPY